MKQIIKYIELISNSSFIPWFLMNNFPEGIDNSNECSLMELIQETCILDKDWIDKLTGYYDGIFDENDGYINAPNSVVISLSNGDELCVEFHPGDTIYYINGSQIGCTGPSYMIRSISLTQFIEYTSKLNASEKILLLPMVKITFEEKDELKNVINSILSTVDMQGCSVEDVSACILENSLE
ncbi:MAG: immunity protein 19 [Lachnospiraceae bacterium]|nr:immunity protein 19 [Lachnospiraceae bacterium]